jgi:signal transduction histidine kinase
MIDTDAPGTIDHDASGATILELVRTPLTAIRAATEILRDHHDLSQVEQMVFVEAMLAESERLAGLVALLVARGGEAEATVANSDPRDLTVRN